MSQLSDVAIIKQTIAALAHPPWVLHEECILKGYSEVPVPNGTIDMIIGCKTSSKTKTILSKLTQGVAISIVNARHCHSYFKPTAAISAKTPKKEDTLKTERQVVIETLAFSEVLRASGTVEMLKASRHSFRPYVYIRPMDVLQALTTDQDNPVKEKELLNVNLIKISLANKITTIFLLYSPEQWLLRNSELRQKRDTELFFGESFQTLKYIYQSRTPPHLKLLKRGLKTI